MEPLTINVCGQQTRETARNHPHETVPLCGIAMARLCALSGSGSVLPRAARRRRQAVSGGDFLVNYAAGHQMAANIEDAAAAGRALMPDNRIVLAAAPAASIEAIAK